MELLGWKGLNIIKLLNLNLSSVSGRRQINSFKSNIAFYYKGLIKLVLSYMVNTYNYKSHFSHLLDNFTFSALKKFNNKNVLAVDHDNENVTCFLTICEDFI